MFLFRSQGPTGLWVPPSDSEAEGGFELAADGGGASAAPPRAVDVFFNILAVAACMLGPYMAMTGLRFVDTVACAHGRRQPCVPCKVSSWLTYVTSRAWSTL